jgi:hypothetical protein
MLKLRTVLKLNLRLKLTFKLKLQLKLRLKLKLMLKLRTVSKLNLTLKLRLLFENSYTSRSHDPGFQSPRWQAEKCAITFYMGQLPSAKTEMLECQILYFSKWGVSENDSDQDPFISNGLSRTGTFGN